MPDHVGALRQESLQGFELDAVELLASRSRRLAEVVVAASRRRDVREFRARLLLLLLELRCPLGASRMRKAWYVPGAVARLGAEGLRRAWRSYYGEEPRTLRTFRAHLSALEQVLAIVRAPGDWLWTLRDVRHPERRPRHPDTIHVLETERVAAWWGTEGRRLLEQHPKARHHPGRWARIFGTWRARAHERQLELFEAEEALAAVAESSPEPAGEEPRRSRQEMARALLAAASGELETLELFVALRRAGVHLRGRKLFELARDPTRLRGAAGMLAVAIARGDRVRSKAGWLVRAFHHAQEAELARARRLARVHVVRGVLGNPLTRENARC